jgi:hypothetical protein
MLLRFDARAPRRFFAKVNKTANLVPETGERPIVLRLKPQRLLHTIIS